MSILARLPFVRQSSQPSRSSSRITWGEPYVAFAAAVDGARRWRAERALKDGLLTPEEAELLLAKAARKGSVPALRLWFEQRAAGDQSSGVMMLGNCSRACLEATMAAELTWPAIIGRNERLAIHVEPFGLGTLTSLARGEHDSTSRRVRVPRKKTTPQRGD